MRTKQGKRLSFETRHILIIDENCVAAVDKKDAREAVEKNEAVLLLRFYAPDICIAVYDFLPREHTTHLALKIAKSYVAYVENVARLN